MYLYEYIGIGSVSINRIPVGPVRVLTAQQLGAFSVFGQFSSLGCQVTWDRYNFDIPWGRLEKVCLRALPA